VFGPRFYVFAMLWRALIGYRPSGPVDVPVRLYRTPDLALSDYWSTIGLPDFQLHDVDATFSTILFDLPSIHRIRTQLVEHEQRARA
jgi:hypothetical protein